MMPSGSFILTAAVLLLTPGPTNTLLASAGASFGLRRAALLPLAEVIGYGLAISAYVVLASSVGDKAVVGLRLASAAWLAWSAIKLWGAAQNGAKQESFGFGRVLLTTLLNPKAMIVGTVLIPRVGFQQAASWVVSFLGLALVAGVAWTALGSAVPRQLARLSQHVAAVALTGFAVLAAASAII